MVKLGHLADATVSREEVVAWCVCVHLCVCVSHVYMPAYSACVTTPILSYRVKRLKFNIVCHVPIYCLDNNTVEPLNKGHSE